MSRLRASWSTLPLVALVLLAAPVAGIAQPKQEREQVAPAPTLVLTGNVRGVRSDATTSRQLAIEVLDVQVRIRGSIAETRMTATFRNSSSDVLEGDFAFDMPAGSVITGYALDVGPDLIDGVLAGRDRAREAYQRRVVQRIDPGLAEVTWGDRFSTRIFPIPAQGSRTIRLVMTSPLDPLRGYVLPMRPAGPVGRFTLGIESDDGTPPDVALPTGVTGTWTAGRFTLDRWDARLGGELRLPPLAVPAPITVSRHANGEEFFEIGRGVRTGAVAGGEPPAKVHIFWDRSVSRADDDIAAERALILAYLEARRAESVTLTLFDSGVAETVRVSSFSDLAERLSAVRYIGGTSFARLSDVPVEDGATCLLVSDGRATTDSRGGFGLPCRTSAIASGREVDRGWLGHVTGRSGGRLVELGSMSRDAALSALLEQSVDVGRLVDDSGRTVEAVALPDGNRRIRLIGPMPMSGGLRLMRGDQVVQNFGRPPIAAPLFSGPGALWASRRISADSDELRTEELVALSRRYSVASPLASFIVLEQPADYVEANIPPPQSYPKALHDQYAAMRTAADQQIAARQAGRLQEVVSLWDDTRAWWNRKYEPVAPGRRERGGALREQPDPEAMDAEEDGNIIVTAQRRDDNALPPPPPPPPPPPAPVVASPGGSDDRNAEIMVTGLLTRQPALDTPMPITSVSAESLAAADADADAGSAEMGSSDRLQDAIQTADWSPGRPWIVAIDAAGAGWADEVERQRRDHGALPLFWFDLAEWHWRNNRPAEARRAVESALDLPSRDNQTLEIVAGRLVRYGDLDRALALYAQLADREDERPQPLRQQALVLMARAEAHRGAGRTEAARADLQQAIALLADAVLKVRREQFRGFETLALMDANLAAQRFRALGGRDHALPRQLVAMLDTDIRIVVEWNTPRTDLDLWVAQPNGERVGFSSTLSSAGGRLTGDVTNGFGPEEFMIRAAPRGIYTIEIDSFASDRTNPNGPSTVQARIIRNFGRPNQSEELVDIEMDPTDDGMRRVGTVEIR